MGTYRRNTSQSTDKERLVVRDAQAARGGNKGVASSSQSVGGGDVRRSMLSLNPLTAILCNRVGSRDRVLLVFHQRGTVV